MLETYRKLIINQFEACFCILNACVERCPDEHWEMKIGIFKFSHVMFHTLIFADLYLSADEESFRAQEFHQENSDFFNQYDELSYDSTETLPDKKSTEKYLQFCREKMKRVIANETSQSLSGPSGFERLKFTRGELHVDNIRHIQHHSAHLSMRLRQEADIEIPWVSSGWKEF